MCKKKYEFDIFLVSNNTFGNNSDISWRKQPGENHRPWASHW